MSCFISSPEEVKEVPWYAQVCELLADMVDQDSHEQDIEDADHSVCYSLLLQCGLSLASTCTVVEERPQYKQYEHCYVDIQCSLIKIQ